MLRHKRLNEAISTVTYFTSEMSIEGYYCAQVFFGMTSKMLCGAGMKTESELPDAYLYFLLNQLTNIYFVYMTTSQ